MPDVVYNMKVTPRPRTVEPSPYLVGSNNDGLTLWGIKAGTFLVVLLILLVANLKWGR